MMAKSIRVNISLPEPLHRLYAEVAKLSGESLPQLLVDAIRFQAAYQQRWLCNIKYAPRDLREGELGARVGVVAVEGEEVVPSPVAGGVFRSGGGKGGLSRQQRRAEERAGRKVAKL